MAQNRIGSRTRKMKSIRGQFLLLFIALALVPVVVASVLFYLQAQNTLTQEIKTSFTDRSTAMAATIESWISERKRDALSLTSIDRIKSLDPAKCEAALKGYFSLWKIYENMFVALPDGSRIYDITGSTANVADRDYFQAALKGEVVMSDPLIARSTGKISVVAAAPVQSAEGKTIAVVVTTTNIEYLTDILKSAWRGEQGEAYLVDKNKALLTQSRFSEKASQELVKAGKIKSAEELRIDTLATNAALAGKTGADVYTSYRGNQVIGAYAPFTTKQWYLVLEQDYQESMSELWKLVTLLGVILAVCVVFAGGLALYFSNSFSQPITAMTNSLNKLALGNIRHNAEKSASRLVRRNDEFGLMNGSLDDTQTYLQEVTGLATRVASGDLTVDVTPRSPEDELGYALQKMVADLTALVGSVRQSSTRMGTASQDLSDATAQANQAVSQIATTIQQVARGTGQQTESITLTTAAVEQLSNGIESIASGARSQSEAVGQAMTVTNQIGEVIHNVSGNAKEVTVQAGLAADVAESSAHKIGDTLKGMESIQTQVSASAAKVREMGERSQRISVIVETIEDISSQTNLLALNAAIEAARAGEHGKGFSVVADEVRKLAERAASATKEIGGLVRDIQFTANEAVSAMDAGTQEVENEVVHAQESGESLKQIIQAASAVRQRAQGTLDAASKMAALSAKMTSAMSDVNSIAAQNSGEAEKMARSAADVLRSIENVASVSEENSAATEEVSASTEQMSAQMHEVSAAAHSLNELAKALQSTVAQFQLDQD